MQHYILIYSLFIYIYTPSHGEKFGHDSIYEIYCENFQCLQTQLFYRINLLCTLHIPILITIEMIR